METTTQTKVFKYHSKEDLLPFVGMEVEFEYWKDTYKKGVLTLENNKLWLPWCGGVNATTLKTCLPN